MDMDGGSPLIHSVTDISAGVAVLVLSPSVIAAVASRHEYAWASCAIFRISR